MRLYLFPITRQRTLIYCKRTRPSLSAPSPSSSSPSSSSSRKPQRWWTSLDGLTGRANSVWVDWEAAPSGWKSVVVRQANKLFATIPYQEWGLKTIPPLSSQQQNSETKVSSQPPSSPTRRSTSVSVVYPARLFQTGQIPDVLQGLVNANQTLYRKRMWYSIVAMPFTLPFALVPIVPNLPFFYLVFRAWSYWRASSGCAHVKHLLQRDLIAASPSEVLQRLWDRGPVDKTVVETLAKRIGERKEEKQTHEKGGKQVEHGMSAVEEMEPEDEEVERLALEILGDGGEGSGPVVNTSQTSEEKLLYPKGHGKVISLTLNMPEVEIELERAHDQVAKDLAKNKPASANETRQ